MMICSAPHLQRKESERDGILNLIGFKQFRSRKLLRVLADRIIAQGAEAAIAIVSHNHESPSNDVIA